MRLWKEVNNMVKKTQKKNTNQDTGLKQGGISYRLKCAKSANGLSHFVMYGDLPKKKTLV